MISIGEKYFYFDIDRIDEVVGSDPSLKSKDVTETEVVKRFDSDGQLVGKEVVSKTYTKGKEIDGSKYETVRYMIEIVMNYADDMTDDKLGFEHMFDNSPLSFKLAFNTLLRKKILKEL